MPQIRGGGSGGGGGGSGDVVGPASSTDGAPAVFDGTDGKHIKEGSPTGITFSALTYSTTGTVAVEPIVNLSAPQPAQFGSSVSAYDGKWAAQVIWTPPNDALTAIEMTDLQGVTGLFTVNGLLGLQTIEAPAMVLVGTLNVLNLPVLTALDLPLLEYVLGAFSPNALALLTTFNIPDLVVVGGAFAPATMAALTTLDAPSLVQVQTNFNPTAMAALTTLGIATLEYVGGTFNPGTMASLTTINAPALKYVGAAFQPATLAALTSVTLPVIETLGGTTASGNAIAFITATAALTTFTLGSTLKRVGNGAGNVVFTSCALNQASVDNILVRLAALDGTGGTTAFSGRTVTITGTSATPSATGLAAKVTLVARSCVVTNN